MKLLCFSMRLLRKLSPLGRLFMVNVGRLLTLSCLVLSFATWKRYMVYIFTLNALMNSVVVHNVYFNFCWLK